MPSFQFRNDHGEIIYEIPISNIEEVFRRLDSNERPTQNEEETQTITVQRKGVQYSTDHRTKKDIDRPSLSSREDQVLKCLGNAFSPEQIAIELGISVRTIRKHIDNLRRKFDADSRDQMMARAGYLGLCNPFQKDTKP
jgi:DNA-binding CsgD family transcriptional regulator